MRYYGGKWKLAPWIISFFPEHRTYVEPFGGAGNVLLQKKPSPVEVYNDLSSEVYNVFRVLRDPVSAAALMDLLRLTPYSREEWLDSYAYADTEDYVENARRTIVRATMSHNPSKVLNRLSNGFRSSSSGHHRLPQTFQSATEDLLQFTNRLRGVILENRDAMKVMQQHDSPTTLHYVDPPYIQSLRMDRRNTYAVEMGTLDQHWQLSIMLKELKGYVILSGYPSKAYTEWYTKAGWEVHSKQAVTGAALHGKSTAMECLWLNPACADAQRQMKMKL